MSQSRFGSGFSELTDSFEAGRQAGAEALSQARIARGKADLCLLFCTSRHDPREFSEGVRAEVGACPFFGGYANGALTNNQMGYDGYQSVVGVLRSDSIQVDLFLQEGIAFNEYETGKALAQQIAASGEEFPYLILLFDAVNRLEGRFRMNYGAPFIKGMNEALKRWPVTTGARLMGDMKFKPTYQWLGDQMVQNAAIALALSGAITMDYIVMHGCKPASAYHTVTAVKGATILEIDHQPALQFVSHILGPEVSGNLNEIKFFVTMGRNAGEKWSDYRPDNYINRMCVGIDEKRGGLRMAERDFDVGTEIQLMRRGFEMGYIFDQTKSLIEKIRFERRKPLFATYFNCAGRAAAYSNNTDEDVRFVQQAIDNEFPLIGIYEAGELAMIKRQLEVLDWTGILCIFSEL